METNLFLNLPQEILAQVLSVLDQATLCSLALSCKPFNQCLPVKSRESILEAIERGYVKLFQWFVTLWSCEWKSASKAAAKGGNLFILKWLYFESKLVIGRKTWSPKVSVLAALHGHLDILNWLRVEDGLHWSFVQNAAQAGHLQILDWWASWGMDIQTLGYVRKGACIGDKVDVLVWEAKMKRPNPPLEPLLAPTLTHGSLNALKFLISSGVTIDRERPWLFIYATKSGNLDMLKWMHHNKFFLSREVATEAARYGHKHVLIWLKEISGPWDKSSILEAAAAGRQLSLLKWLKDEGLWEGRTEREKHASESCISLRAAMNGDVEMLMWLKEIGAKFSSSVCTAAAKKGSLETLKWLRSIGCEWDETTTSGAILNLHYEVFEYCTDNGCPVPDDICNVAYMLTPPALPWLHKKGYREVKKPPLDEEPECYLGPK